jgi:hypothetical protein
MKTKSPARPRPYQGLPLMERYVIETCIGGFPWKPYARTDDGAAALQCAADQAEQGYYARILDLHRKVELQQWQHFLPTAHRVMHLGTGEERAYRAESEVAVRLAWRRDHPGEEPPPTSETPLQHCCGDWCSIRSDLTPEQITARVREATRSLHAARPQSEETEDESSSRASQSVDDVSPGPRPPARAPEPTGGP